MTLELARNECTASRLAALSRERACGADLNRRIGAPLVGLESWGGGDKSLVLSAIKPRFVGCQDLILVTVSTTSFRQLYRVSQEERT